MASSFSANQYDSAFKAQRLQNWCEAKHFKERPSAQVSHTFIADNKGHLLPGVKKGSAWPDFKGTWDLPTRIPAHRINPTARSAEGLSRLRSWGFCPQQSSRSADVDEQTGEDVQEGGADPASPARTQSQTVSRNQNHRSQSAAVVSAEPASSAAADRQISNGPETSEHDPVQMTRSRQTQQDLQPDL